MKQQKIVQFMFSSLFIAVWALSSACIPTSNRIPEEKLHSGDIAPLFSLADGNGERHSLDTYFLEKPTLLVFFSADCPPCRMELKRLSQIRNYQRIQGNRGLSDFNVLLVTKSSPSEVFQMEKEIGKVNFIVLYDTEQNVMRDYGIFAFPYNFLIGRDGRIILVLLGYYEDMIERIQKTISSAGL